MSAAADTFWPFLDARDDDDDDDGGTTNAGGGDFNGVGALDGPDALVRHGRCDARENILWVHPRVRVVASRVRGRRVVCDV